MHLGKETYGGHSEELGRFKGYNNIKVKLHALNKGVIIRKNEKRLRGMVFSFNKRDS